MKKEFDAPSFSCFGTIHNLTAGGTQGCSEDTFDNVSDENEDFSILSPGQGVPDCGDN